MGPPPDDAGSNDGCSLIPDAHNPDAQNDENNEDKSDEEASAAPPDDKADERSAPPDWGVRRIFVLAKEE